MPRTLLLSTALVVTSVTAAFAQSTTFAPDPWHRSSASFILPSGPMAVDDALDQPLPWHNGSLTSVGTNIACLSDPPIQQIRTQAYTGYSLRPPNRTPAVGEVFYTHLIVSHPGNPCSGSLVGLEMLLPAGVQPATSASNPAFCFAVLPPSTGYPAGHLVDLSADPGYGCPQTFAQGLEGLRVAPPHGGGSGTGAWFMRQGVYLELLIPLQASQAQVGNTSIRFRINPEPNSVGYASVPLHVNNDVIFRHRMEDDLLSLEVCGLSQPPFGCG